MGIGNAWIHNKEIRIFQILENFLESHIRSGVTGIHSISVFPCLSFNNNPTNNSHSIIAISHTNMAI